MASATQRVRYRKRTVTIGVNKDKKSRGDVTVKSYTRTVNGEKVRVKGYTRKS